jgi:Ni/Co efflux regulator RcnB
MSFQPRPHRLLVLLIAAIIGAAPALAAPHGGKGDDDKGEKHENKGKKGGDDHGGSRGKGHDSGKGHGADKDGHMAHAPKPGAHFNDKSRSSVQAYYARNKDCPPGLAKKHNGCMPPGQLKKWQVGQPMPAGVAFAPVPQQVLVMLPSAPVGHRYVAYGGDILLIAASSRMVVDGISITVNVR